MIKPLQALSESVGKSVIVALKGNKEYRGTLNGYDPHMNLVLQTVQVYIAGEKKEEVASLLVRGDNVIYISP